MIIRERERERERQREREYSELYYSRTEILGNSLFLQSHSVLADLHRQHTHTKRAREGEIP